MPGKKPGGSEQLKRRLREDNDMDAEKKETRIAIIAIVVENPESVGEMNRILHNFGEYIIGRMGIPYREKKISLISVAIDAPAEIISALTGKLGRVDGVTVKTAYSKI